MDRSGIDNILEQLNAASALTSGVKKPVDNSAATEVDFSQTLRAAVDKVNDVQQKAGQLSRDFVSGESNADLHEVMVSLQKANVSFQSMVQVRNKLVTAYQEIMNMQV
ncbi:flagellar hook-basal body complex protein FliE [Nitrosomonas marina]|uniref:Flagellar hook-basal body complex protein FliE n=1 Tax=Nitrosomonas marina TaxID=917 RepID=A0A1H8FHT3_9PROT|nr:flagellar hook-basal body complex protein FliE [Nitrosomonas marina]SEN31196.1 flagellar hook-basal body complex protein FliE [Nitrosomonas marina]